MPDNIDFDQLVREVVASLRGRQTPRAASKRLGFGSNIVGRWERGERKPYADDIFRWAHLRGVDVTHAIGEATELVLPGVQGLTPLDDDYALAVVEAVIHGADSAQVEAASGMSRHRLGRLRRREVRPVFADLLRLLESVNRSTLMFLEHVVDVDQLPTLATRWAEHREHMHLYERFPQVGHLLNVLQRIDYLELQTHDSAWVSELMQLPVHDIELMLSESVRVGLVRRDGAHFRHVGPEGRVRIHATDRGNRDIAIAHTEVALERLRSELGTTAWSSFSVAEEAVPQIADVFIRALAEVEQIAEANPGDRLGLALVHLIPMDGAKLPVRPGERTED